MNVFKVTVPSEKEVVDWIQTPRVMLTASHPWKTALLRDRVLDNISRELDEAGGIEQMRDQLVNLLIVVREINRP